MIPAHQEPLGEAGETRWAQGEVRCGAAGAGIRRGRAGARARNARPVRGTGEHSGRAGTISFDAYGRRFTAELDANDRVTAKLGARRKADLSRYRILKGKLVGESRSWVRLAESAGRIEGAIWDGQDLYVVTTLAGIAANLTTPIAAAPEQTVIYRLSDTIDAFPPACVRCNPIRRHHGQQWPQAISRHGCRTRRACDRGGLDTPANRDLVDRRHSGSGENSPIRLRTTGAPQRRRRRVRGTGGIADPPDRPTGDYRGAESVHRDRWIRAARPGFRLFAARMRSPCPRHHAPDDRCILDGTTVGIARLGGVCSTMMASR